MDTEAVGGEQKRRRRQKGLGLMQACRARHEIMGEDTLFTNKEVARLLGCSVRQIYFMIHRQKFLHPQKLGVLSRWRLGVVRDWIRKGPARVVH